MPENDGRREITPYDYEHMVWHLGKSNHRMLIALITVCVTFIVTILVFVHGYTVREKNWLDTIFHLQNGQCVECQTDMALP